VTFDPRMRTGMCIRLIIAPCSFGTGSNTKVVRIVNHAYRRINSHITPQAAAIVLPPGMQNLQMLIGGLP